MGATRPAYEQDHLRLVVFFVVFLADFLAAFFAMVFNHLLSHFNKFTGRAKKSQSFFLVANSFFTMNVWKKATAKARGEVDAWFVLRVP